jgi:hypothetical protein
MGVEKMLLPQKVKVKWCYRNREHYESKGHIFTKTYGEFEVDVFDLTDGNHSMVDIECDYCGETFKRVYKDYIKFFKKSPTKKDCCDDCRPLKMKETSMTVYGIEHASQVPEVVLKRKETNLNKYGSETPLGSLEIQEKARETVREIYGVDNVFQIEEVKDKIVEWNYKTYGVKHPMHIEEIKKSRVAKRSETMYKNGSIQTSQQQLYLRDVFDGELNYPIDNCMLDIAFPNDKIYIEYQGSGHDLDVKLKKLTKDQFDNKEKNRYYFIRNNGWKMIEIISVSQYDYLPMEDKLKEMFEFAKEYLLNGRSWIQFDIDKGIVRGSKINMKYDFGELITFRNQKYNLK